MTPERGMRRWHVHASVVSTTWRHFATRHRVIGAQEFKKNQKENVVTNDPDIRCFYKNDGTKDEIRGILMVTRHIWEPKGARLTATEVLEAHNIARMTYQKAKGTGLSNHFATLLADGAFHKVSQKSKECDSLGAACLLFK